MSEKTGKRLTIAALLAWIVLQLYTSFDITAHNFYLYHICPPWHDHSSGGTVAFVPAGSGRASVFFQRAAAASGAEMVLGSLCGAGCRAMPAE